MDEKEKLEKTMTDALTDGVMDAAHPEEAAVERLSPRYEIRQTVELDPILEETRIIRSISQEVDDRYDDYVSRATKKKEKKV